MRSSKTAKVYGNMQRKGKVGDADCLLGMGSLHGGVADYAAAHTIWYR